MEYKQNLHTHTIYCDGKDSPEEMILRAIELGFDSIGFSGHSYMWFSPQSRAMTRESTGQYKKEIFALKQKYQGRIDVYCGLEAERYSKVDLTGYDYVIGSVHYLLEQGAYLSVDRSAEVTKSHIDKYFHGDSLQYAKKYYETVATLPDGINLDIVGHFDLLTKYQEKARLIDEDSKIYQSYAIEALKEVSKKCRLFEVNTGAIGRGHRTTPYPAPFILKEMKQLGCQVILSSDCHDKTFLDCAFKDSIVYIQSCGFDEIYVMKNGKFTGVKL